MPALPNPQGADHFQFTQGLTEEQQKMSCIVGWLNNSHFFVLCFNPLIWAPPRRELWVTVGFPPSLQPCHLAEDLQDRR